MQTFVREHAELSDAVLHAEHTTRGSGIGVVVARVKQILQSSGGSWKAAMLGDAYHKTGGRRRPRVLVGKALLDAFQCVPPPTSRAGKDFADQVD